MINNANLCASRGQPTHHPKYRFQDVRRMSNIIKERICHQSNTRRTRPWKSLVLFLALTFAAYRPWTNSFLHKILDCSGRYGISNCFCVAVNDFILFLIQGTSRFINGLGNGSSLTCISGCKLKQHQFHETRFHHRYSGSLFNKCLLPRQENQSPKQN